jgi:hypothetical protein
MTDSLNPAAPHHLPWFITAPGQTDGLFTAMIVFLLAVLFLIGVLYFKLHALPEHMAHRTSKVQLEFVAVLSVIALFTHEHLFWIIALLLAMVELPDFSTPINLMAQSLQRLAGGRRAAPEPAPNAELTPDAGPAPGAEASATHVAPPAEPSLGPSLGDVGRA